MVNVPNFFVVRAVEESMKLSVIYHPNSYLIAHLPIMTGAVISVSRTEYRATLGPTSRIGRVTTLVCQQTKLVRTSPAITRRVSQECLSAVVERSGPFIDWKLANFLPW